MTVDIANLELGLERQRGDSYKQAYEELLSLVKPAAKLEEECLVSCYKGKHVSDMSRCELIEMINFLTKTARPL